jgi:hypothetical protein
MQNQGNRWFPPPGHFPFYYATLSSLTVFYRAPIEVLRPFLKNTRLEPAEVGGRGLGVVSLELQNYCAHFGVAQAPSNPGMSATNEVELDIIAYPERWKKEDRVPEIGFEDFVLGQEESKTLGSYRVDVPADDLVAVQAGADTFGEQKFYTMFDYNIPCENNLPSATNPASLTDWSYTVLDPKYAEHLRKHPNAKRPPKTPAKDFIYQLEAHLGKLYLGSPSPRFGNPSPITLFSTLPKHSPCTGKNPVTHPKCWDRRRPTKPSDTLIASNWNIRGTFTTYLKGLRAGTVVVTLGKSDDPMRNNLSALVKNENLAAVRVFQSQPAATESRPCFVNIEKPGSAAGE